MSEWPGKEDLIRRIMQTPLAQDILTQLRAADENGWGPEEIVARIYLVLEDNVNWGVDCGSCASLLNKLYATDMELAHLKDSLREEPKSRVCDKCPTTDPLIHFHHGDF